jgi:hypothetical protein
MFDSRNELSDAYAYAVNHKVDVVSVRLLWESTWHVQHPFLASSFYHNQIKKFVKRLVSTSASPLRVIHTKKNVPKRRLH